ncbi:superoxide dismutase [Candidatus Collierbacteria bacterium RIFCSPLOWO2_01_FULL_50_23]|uniref:Superoxide dismutase n=2 Tax=Candidatus Collieribacteriota TaxID=1752725 RepID=A0A1F5EVH2_9BACT|nr:MAG: superoxide dismutase [Candidatus Collierbacteria bacterium RIFCSPHIGHO2_02_FULL_49_10]OGD71616.1 MAG: superoxide dismutase [Candidatus Collierbacteria bacterium RIFCSPHIGHO2_01_FULL_50_25]OGD74430.1 MAG: superoxide dismutase [Candidatus Collierbacteria bacterium RIFCSPLOWO2_01_FULL_50_23]
MTHTLPELSYSFDALEPHIDARTMEIHLTKHHQAYVDNLNKALTDFPELSEKPLGELLSDLPKVPEKIRMAVRNHGGGHYNHSLFWRVMGHATGGEPVGKLAEALKKEFGDLAKFTEQFNAAAMSRFGSGWAWLCVKAGKLEICSTPNQDNPLMEGKKPLLGLDVWEHAYYLKYQNRRKDYVEAWWKVVNWVEVEKNLES